MSNKNDGYSSISVSSDSVSYKSDKSSNTDFNSESSSDGSYDEEIISEKYIFKLGNSTHSMKTNDINLINDTYCSINDEYNSSSSISDEEYMKEKSNNYKDYNKSPQEQNSGVCYKKNNDKSYENSCNESKYLNNLTNCSNNISYENTTEDKTCIMEKISDCAHKPNTDYSDDKTEYSKIMKPKYNLESIVQCNKDDNFLSESSAKYDLLQLTECYTECNTKKNPKKDKFIIGERNLYDHKIKNFYADNKITIEDHTQIKYERKKIIISTLKGVKDIYRKILMTLHSFLKKILILKSCFISHKLKKNIVDLYTRYKNLINDLIKNLKNILSKRKNGYNLIENKIIFSKCDKDGNVSYKNIYYLDKSENIVLVYSIPGICINYNVKYHSIKINMTCCKYGVDSNYYNTYSFDLLPALDIECNKLNIKNFLETLDTIINFRYEESNNINEFIKHINSSIEEIDEILN